jgi:hypothetical protein
VKNINTKDIKKIFSVLETPKCKYKILKDINLGKKIENNSSFSSSRERT